MGMASRVVLRVGLAWRAGVTHRPDRLTLTLTVTRTPTLTLALTLGASRVDLSHARADRARTGEVC